MTNKALILFASVIFLFSSCSQSRYGYISRYKENKKQESAVAKENTEETKADIEETEADIIAAENPKPLIVSEEKSEIAALPVEHEVKSEKKSRTEKVKRISRGIKSILVSDIARKAVKPMEDAVAQPVSTTEEDGNCCVFIVAIVLLYLLVYVLAKGVFGITISFWVFLGGLLALALLIAIIAYAKN